MQITTTRGKTYTAWDKICHRGGTRPSIICEECGNPIVYAETMYRVYLSSIPGSILKRFGHIHTYHVMEMLAANGRAPA